MFKKFFGLFLLLLVVACETVKIPQTGTGNSTQNQPYDNIDTISVNISQKNKLKVGILLPLTGTAAKVGNSMLQSAELSLFNSKSNNILLMPYDTKGTSFGAVDAINAAVRDEIDIIIGPLFTQSTKAILDIAETNDLLVLSFSDNQSLLEKNNPNLYLMGLTPQQEIYRIISYLIDYKGAYGFSAMFPTDAYGNMVSKDFKNTLFRKDAKIVKTEFYSKKDPNLQKKVNNLLNTNSFREEVYTKYEEELQIAKIEGSTSEVEFTYTDEDKIFADALLVPDSGEELLKIGQYVFDYTGQHKPLLVGTSKWLNNSLYNNPNFNNTLFVAPNLDSYTDFENLYLSTYGSYPIRVSALAYDAVKVVIESYAKAKNKEDLRYAIENYQGFNGANGKFRFLSTGLLERRLAIIRISNGTYEIIDYDNEPFLKY